VSVTATSPSTVPEPSDPRAAHPPASDQQPAGEGGATAELTVEGMHCGACVALIEESLSEQPGVNAASVDLDSARAVVRYDPDVVGTDDLRAAIAEAGYSATVVG
jgi:copper chaperone CopZ